MAKAPLQRVEELFHQAVTLGPEDQSVFLDGACRGDPDLRAEVEALLKHDAEHGGTDSFLVSPLAGVVTAYRSDAPTHAGAAPAGMTEPESRPKIAGYDLLTELGRGGMGVVYLARQTSLNRLVALKMLLPTAVAAPEMMERFRTEAEALARLNHPNVVPVYEISVADGRPYFTMEYIPGPSLARVLNQRPQDGRLAAGLIETLARTIHAVHACGIVHRDLKPANVLLQHIEGGGRVYEPASQPLDLSWFVSPASLLPKVTDFGLAKDLHADRKLTRTGTVLGTPAYMAPEQVRRPKGGIGPAADIYALGSILYEMLTGRPPFDAESPVDVIEQLLYDEPLSPSRLRPRLPRDLVTICLQCLEKSPRRRYATAWHLAEDLRRYQAGEPIRARPVRWIGRVSRWCRRRPLVAALIALSAAMTLALIGTAVVYDFLLTDALKQAREKGEDERQQIVRLNVRIGMSRLESGDHYGALLRFTEALRLDEGEANHRTRIAATLRQSPVLVHMWTPAAPVLCRYAGDSGAWLATADADHQVLVWDLWTGQSVAPAWRQDDAPIDGAFSRDGHFLATVSAAGLVRVRDLRIGTVQELPPQANRTIRRVVLAADGRRLLAQDTGSALELWDLTACPPVRLWRLPGSEVAATALSDGACWLLTLDAGRGGRVWDLATGEPVDKPLIRDQLTIRAAISKDGRRAALLGANLNLRFWDVTTAGWLGEPLRLQDAVSQIVFRPDAEQVIMAGRNGTIQVAKVKPASLATFASGFRGAVSQLQLNTDGSQALFITHAGETSVWDVATGQPAIPPLPHPGPVALAAFGADGSQVVVAGREGTVRVWQRPTVLDSHGRAPDREPDANEARVAGGPRTVTLRDGTTVQVEQPVSVGRPLGPVPASQRVKHAVFSPDGRRVVVGGEDHTARVCDASTGGVLTPPLRHGGTVVHAAFSADGRRLLTADDAKTARVWDSETAELLAPPLRLGRALKHASFHPDGTHATLIGDGGVRRTWDLSASTQSLAELIALAQLLSGSRIDEKQYRQDLDANDLRSLWTRLRAAP